ncbi:MAG: tRNA uridine-5-carboxymethylaminomethyl(34) synthesis GTPase MnmE [Bacilli bacterium]|nr:tRNA uridine-5-carboxymethylaminomethyl(34) synthesis GTPase MnmE [Bacilli bacterium]
METIVASASAPIKSALSIVRVSGDEAFSITEKLLGKPIYIKDRAGILHGVISLDGKTIDDCVLLCYPHPHSMTGEDVVEVCCHGSPLIVDEIVEAYIYSGARMASPGEFTSRAFYNGKLDLVQAEAINDLINAATRESKDVALLSLNGKTSATLSPLLGKVGEILASAEVGIDYPEYDEEEPLSLQKIQTQCRTLRDELSHLVDDGAKGQYLRQGVDVAIVGEPNVGKSSLLNALLSEQKAIVSNIPGTTRDVVEGTISIHGLPIRLSDTAGIRESSDALERLGVERSKKTLEKAQLVLLVRSEDEESDLEEELMPLLQGKTVLEVWNKSDLVTHREVGKLYASAIQGDVEEVKEAIYRAFKMDEAVYSTPAFSSQRELGLLREALSLLRQAIDLADQGATIDVIASVLQEAYNALRRVLGLDPTQDFSDEIFSRFCVGK